MSGPHYGRRRAVPPTAAGPRPPRRRAAGGRRRCSRSPTNGSSAAARPPPRPLLQQTACGVGGRRRSRECVHFGVARYSKVDDAPVEPLPAPLHELLDALTAAGVLAPDGRPDSCCINYYGPARGCRHRRQPRVAGRFAPCRSSAHRTSSSAMRLPAPTASGRDPPQPPQVEGPRAMAAAPGEAAEEEQEAAAEEEEKCVTAAALPGSRCRLARRCASMAPRPGLYASMRCREPRRRVSLTFRRVSVATASSRPSMPRQRRRRPRSCTSSGAQARARPRAAARAHARADQEQKQAALM